MSCHTSRDAARLSRINQRIAELETQLSAIPAGIQSASVDGTSTTWNRKALVEEIQMWEDQAAALTRRRVRSVTMRLDNAF